MEWFAGLAIWVLLVSLVIYFLPTMIAVARGHKNWVTDIHIEFVPRLDIPGLDWSVCLVLHSSGEVATGNISFLNAENDDLTTS